MNKFHLASRRWIPLIILVLLPFIDVSAQNNSQIALSNNKLYKARQLLIEGTDCLHNNQNQQAKAKLLSACEIAPDLPQAHHQFGIALAKLGENEQAINEFSQAIKLDPNVAASWLNLAAVYQTSGNIEQAKVTYQEFLNRFPKDKDVNKIRALVESLNIAASAFTQPSSNVAQITNEDTNKIINQKTNSGKDDDYYLEVSGRGIWLWPKDCMPLRIYIERAKAGNGASDEYITILKDAFRDWAVASKGIIDINFVDSTGKADIICTWSRDSTKFKNSSEAANTRVYAKNGKLYKGQVEILTISSEDSRPITSNQARATSLHEVGHILGLTGHSNNLNDIMYISANLKDSWANLSYRDINTLLRLYSAN